MTTVPRPAEQPPQTGQKHCAMCRKPLTDRLTGVLDRLEWDNRASRAAARARLDGLPLALILVDLDRFKSVNDRYGHLAGDAVLRAVAGALDGIEDSVVGRYGGHAGDEFLILLPGATEEQALAVARQAQDEIRDMPVSARSSRSSTVTLSGQTASMGVAAASGSGAARASLADLLLDADVALRAAKRAGGDRAYGSSGAGGMVPELPELPDLPELPRQRQQPGPPRPARPATPPAPAHVPHVPAHVPAAAPQPEAGAYGQLLGDEVRVPLDSIAAEAADVLSAAATGELVLSSASARRLYALLGEALGRAPATAPAG